MLKLGRLRRSVLTYQSDRKRRYNLMAVDPTQWFHGEGGPGVGGLLVSTANDGQPWTYDGSSRLQVPAGLYYMQLSQILTYPMTGVNGPVLTIAAYASNGGGGERVVVGAHGIVTGEEAPSVNLVAYVDQGIEFSGFAGRFTIDVVQIAPLA